MLTESCSEILIYTLNELRLCTASFAESFLETAEENTACKKDLNRLPCFSKSPPEKLRLQCCSHNSPCRQWIFVRSCAHTCVRSMIAFPAFTLRKTAKDEKVFSTGAFSSAVSSKYVPKRSRDILFQALLVILHKIISVFVTGEEH